MTHKQAASAACFLSLHAEQDTYLRSTLYYYRRIASIPCSDWYYDQKLLLCAPNMNTLLGSS